MPMAAFQTDQNCLHNLHRMTEASETCAMPADMGDGVEDGRAGEEVLATPGGLVSPEHVEQSVDDTDHVKLEGFAEGQEPATEDKAEENPGEEHPAEEAEEQEAADKVDEDADVSHKAAAEDAAVEHPAEEAEGQEDSDMVHETAAEHNAEEHPAEEAEGHQAADKGEEDAHMSHETAAEEAADKGEEDADMSHETAAEEAADKGDEDADMSHETAAEYDAEEQAEGHQTADKASGDADMSRQTAGGDSAVEQEEVRGQESADEAVDETASAEGDTAAPAEEVGEEAVDAAVDDEESPPQVPEADACDPSMRDSMPFTPKKIDPSLCMARIWGDCKGGQCSNFRASGSEFCGRHKKHWEVHGRVDGPIPEKKLKEFQRHQARLARAAARAGKEGKDGEAHKTPKKAVAASAGERCTPKPSGPSPGSKSSKKSRVSTSSRSTDEPTSSKVPRKQAQGLSDEETTAEENAEKRASRNLKRKRQATPKEGKVDARVAKSARKAKSASKTKTSKPKQPRKAEKAWKCTCGKPIHSEKCKLFRPSFLHTRFPARATTSRAGRFMVSPRKTRPALPPPSVQLSRTASEQVVKISAEIEKLPKDQRRSAWKNQMRMYHPDKKSVFPNLSEEQMNEVFVEIKRRYDFAARQQHEDLVPPARQFWGSAR